MLSSKQSFADSAEEEEAILENTKNRARRLCRGCAIIRKAVKDPAFRRMLTQNPATL